jgi:hypothetical protein
MKPSVLRCYPKTKTNMFVIARKVTRRFFGVRLFAKLIWSTLANILKVVVPAWTAGTQVHPDVSGRIPADLDAGRPCRHDGCDVVIVG